MGGARSFGCLVLGVAGVGCCGVLFAVHVEGITQGVHQGNAIGQQCLGGGRCCCFTGSRWWRFAHATSLPHTSTTAAAGRALTAAQQRMAVTPVGDRAAWSAFARDGAGVFAAMAQQLPDRRVRTPLTQAAHALACAAWRAPHRHIERPPDGGALWRVAQAMLTVGGAQSEVFGTLVLVQQMMRLAQTISDSHEAAGRLGQARWAAEAAERAGLAAHRMQTASAPPTRERGAEPQHVVPESAVAAGQRTKRPRQRPSDTGAVREDREWGR